MNRPKRRVLVHGAGSIGMRHARNLGGMTEVELRVLPIRDGRRVELGAQGFTPTDLDGAEAFAPDLVVVATDTHRHVTDALRWLQAGAWTLVEKPVSVDAPSLGALAGYDHMRVACVMRAHPTVRELRHRLPRVGPVHAVRIEAQSYLPGWRPDRDYRSSYSADPVQGGVLRDLVHELDLAVWIFGCPSRVQAWLHCDPVLDIVSETSADLAWGIEGGGRLTMRLDYVTRPARRRIVVDGRDGSFTADLQGRRWLLQLADGSCEEGRSEASSDGMYLEQLQAMLSLCSGGEDSIPLPGYHEAREVMELMDAARRSAELGGALVLLEGA